MTRNIVHGDLAKDGLAEGVEKLYTAVSSTLGPLGNTVIIEDTFGGSPVITKDGVTVARNLVLKDQIQNLGVEIVKQVASKTEELVGDGTTTATVLAYSLYEKCREMLDTSLSVNQVRSLIKELQNYVCNKIDSDTVIDLTDNDIYNIAMISSNGDEEISNLLKNAYNSVGKDGYITVDTSNTVKTELHVSNGTELNSSYVSPYFINNPATGECILKDCLVLLSSVPLVSDSDILPALKISSEKRQPILVLAPNIVGDALSTFVVNIQKQTISGCAVKIPNLVNPIETLKDLSVLTGAKVVPECGIKLSELSIDQLGIVGNVRVNNRTTILSDFSVPNDDINSYISYLDSNVKPNLKFYELPGYDKRISRLRSKAAIIKVGGQTNLEVSERKDRVDDATYAVKAALDGGIVIGSGKELYNIANNLPDNLIEFSDVLKAPFNKIHDNGGVSPNINLGTDECVDLRSGISGKYREIGIVDPAKVTRTVIKNAVSIVDILLSTDLVLICDEVGKTPLSDKVYS